jgi:DNA-binding CsgD family transcriptional regulator
VRFITALIFTFLVIFYETGTCQEVNLNPKDWAEKLEDRHDIKNEPSELLIRILMQKDSATVFNFLNKLGNQSSAEDDYFTARYYCIKARYIAHFYLGGPAYSSFIKDSIKREVTGLLEEAMQHAYIADDDYLAAYVSSMYGNAMSGFGNTEKGVMYMMYSAELYDKLHLSATMATYIVLGETLWRVREYKKSIYYTKIAISLLMASDHKKKIAYLATCNNTLGLAFDKMGLYDSAFFYYEKGLKFASEADDKNFRDSWKGIISGNMAQIGYVQGKYEAALPLFEMDYETNKEQGYYADAANSLQWAAKTNLALGNKGLALRQVRESFNLLEKWPNSPNYRQNAYLTASEIFKSLGNNDSAYYYSTKYNLLHDSVERVIYESGISISKLRLSNEKNRYNIQNLELEKKSQLQMRNFIIAVMVLLCAIALLFINYLRHKSKLKAQFEYQEKKRMEQEMEVASDQLKMFTKSIIEKTSLIEKLESQMQNKYMSEERQQLIEEISGQSILTEDDWLKFKTLFEKLYPDFFSQINKQVKNITQAEQRLAALTLLHLTTKQMAAVLGISPNSVIKAKQRLRQRFEFQTYQEVEEFMESITNPAGQKV